MADQSIINELENLAGAQQGQESIYQVGGGKRRVNAPDQSGFVSDVILRTGLGQGLLMGAGDEVEAYFRSTFGSDTYDKALEKVRQKLSVAQTERPFQTGAAEIGGSLLPVVASMFATAGTGGVGAPAAAATTARTAGLVSRMLSTGAKAAGIGAAQGATEGFLKGEGTENRLGGAVEQGLTGGAFGAGLGLAAPLAKSAYQTAFAAPEQRAATRMVDILGEQGLTPQQVATEYAARQATTPKPEILADLYGGGILGETRRVANVPGANRGEISGLLRGRAEEQGGRVQGAFQEALGTQKKFFPILDDLEQVRKVEAAPLYTIAYGMPARTPALDELIKRVPEQAFKQAKDVAKTEGLIFPKLTQVNKQGSTEIVSDYAIKDVDLIKRGLDDLIEANRINNPSAARRYTSLKNEITDEADKLSPEYAAARAAWAGPSAVMDAMKKGGDVFNERAELTFKDISKLGASEKEGFLIGVLDAVNQRLGRKIEGQDVTSAFRSGNAKAQVEAALSAAVKDPVEVKKIADTLFYDIEREARMSGTNRALNQISQTAPMLAEEASFRAGMGPAAQIGRELAQGNILGAAGTGMTSGLTALSTGLSGRTREATNSQLAKYLFARTPQDVNTAMAELTRRAAQSRGGSPSYTPGLLAGPTADIFNR